MDSGIPHAPAAPGESDAALYHAIDQRVLGHEPYYRAAAAEQRLRDYPLKPFVTVRLPTLAWTYRVAGGAAGALILMRLIGLATLMAIAFRLREALGRSLVWPASSLLSALAIGVLLQPGLVVWHEVWAGLLVALSLAGRSGRRWWPSILLGFIAVLFRELALPYLVAMAAAALWEKRPVEAAGWGIAILASFVALALHAHAVAAELLSGDRASQGWAALGGWRFDLALLRDSSLFSLAPRPVGGPLVVLALLGWGAWRGAFAGRVALTLALWLGAFLFIGRPVNFYWGLMIAPLLPVGLPLAVTAIQDIVHAATGPVGPAHRRARQIDALALRK